MATTYTYQLGPVKSWVQNAAYIIGPLFGIKTIYGWERVDPYGFPDHPSGHALDFMIPSTDTGNRLASYVIANADALGVKYLIWDRRYWSRSTGWKPYTATSNPHTDHVHVTFNDAPGPADAGPRITSPSPGTPTSSGGGGTVLVGSSTDPLPTFGPGWLPWNWPSNIGNDVLAQTRLQLSGVRSILIEGAFVTLALGLAALGLWRIARDQQRKAIDEMSPL